MNKQKGSILAVVLVAVLVVLGGGYLYVNHEATKELERQNDISEAISDTLKTGEENEIELGETQKTGTPVTAKIIPNEDSFGNKGVSVLIDEELLKKGVIEKYEGNTDEIHKLIKAYVITSLSNFQVKAAVQNQNEKTYKNVCNDVNNYLKTEIQKMLNREGTIDEEIGVTIDSFRINELICKSNSTDFVITVPFSIDGGGDGLWCASTYSSGGNGVDYENYKCIK